MSYKEVCVSENTLSMYLFVLLCILVYLVYIAFAKKRSNARERLSNVDLLQHLSKDELYSKVQSLQDSLYQKTLSEQKCQIDLIETRKNCSDPTSTQVIRNRFMDPLQPPTRIYPGGRFNNMGTSQYQQIGYVYDDGGSVRFPLFGRYKYPGRSDRWEYYVIDESRNRLKIPFKSKNDTELFDGDTISVPTVANNIRVKIYDYDEFRYDPNIL